MSSSYNVLEDPAILAKLQPVEYHKKWFERFPNKRIDGRTPEQSRPVTIQRGNISTADASSTVTLGNTLIITGIKCEVAEPKVGCPDMGYIVCNVTFAAGCSSEIRAGPPSDRAQLMTHHLSALLNDLNVIDDAALVAEEGKLVWCLYIDAVVINDAGNVFDATWLSVLAALRDVRLPAVQMNADSGMVEVNAEAPSKAILSVDSLPLPISFLKINDNLLVVDPSSDEEMAFTDGRGLLLFRVSDSDDSILDHSESQGVSPSAISQLSSSPSIHVQLKALRQQLLCLLSID